MPTGGLDRARAPASGLITSLQVKLDDPVTSGQVVATIWPGRVAQSGTGVPPRGSGIPVVAPCDGQVLEVSNNENDWVEAGHSMIIVGGAASSLEAWAFMPYSKGWRVRS
ncbi:MAG: hypothetical protein FJW37_13115, partial [Acidobacteria bacterium]|nr:hypothetical protein [Acidobacteriota bacterium]